MEDIHLSQLSALQLARDRGFELSIMQAGTKLYQEFKPSQCIWIDRYISEKDNTYMGSMKYSEIVQVNMNTKIGYRGVWI